MDRRPPRGDGSDHDNVVYAGWEDLPDGVLYGHAVPRIHTKPLRELHAGRHDSFGQMVEAPTSLGFLFITWARDMFGIRLDPWQRWLVIHMLETRPDDRLRFSTGLVLVARQNGKSTLSQLLSLFFMMVMSWPVVVGTAQDLPTAEEVYEGAIALLEDDDELASLIADRGKTNGKKFIRLTSGERYLVKAANRKAGRGLSGNFVLLDELREQHNWAAWAAITKTTNAQRNRFILGLSNAGDLASIVLRHLREVAHRQLGDPDGILVLSDVTAPSEFEVETDGAPDLLVDVEDGEEPGEDQPVTVADLTQSPVTLFLAEWSAEPGIDRRERLGWQQANGSLGYRGMQEETLVEQVEIDAEWTFRTEVLCQWPSTSLAGPFPPGSWEAGVNTLEDTPAGPRVRAEDRTVGPLDLCIDMSEGRAFTYVAAVGVRPDGKHHVVILAARQGTGWVRSFIMQHADRKRFRYWTGQDSGAPVSGLVKTLVEDGTFTLRHRPWKGGDLMAAFGSLFDAVRDETIRHHRQAVLDMAAGTAVTKRLGDAWVIDRSASEIDAAPLVAASGAYWLATAPPLRELPPPPAPVALSTITPASGRSPSTTGGGRSRRFDF